MKDLNDLKEKKQQQTDEQLHQRAYDTLCHCGDPKIVKKSQYRLKDAMPDFRPQLKDAVWQIGNNLIRTQKKFYDDDPASDKCMFYRIYVDSKQYYENRGDLKAEKDGRKGKAYVVRRANGETEEKKSEGTGHIHKMAMRYMCSQFLQELWLAWRKIDGLSVTEPYVIGIMGHTKRDRRKA